MKKENGDSFDFMLTLMLAGINTAIVLTKKKKKEKKTNIQRSKLINENTISIFSLFLYSLFTKQ